MSFFCLYDVDRSIVGFFGHRQGSFKKKNKKFQSSTDTKANLLEANEAIFHARKLFKYFGSLF